jgi:excinuclease UvrABC helicase subunit UvrB
MGNLTLSSLPTVEQYDVNKSIIQPIFMGQDYMQYMEVLPNIKGTTVIDKFNQLGKITVAASDVAFAAGSDSAKGDTITLTPARVEAEIEFRAKELFNKMKGQVLRAGTRL